MPETFPYQHIGPREQWIDLGDNHLAFPMYCGHLAPISGWLIAHPAAGNDHHPKGEPCLGQISICRGCTGATWDLISREPLHVEPSVLCSCGDHGFIRDGRWVVA